jgi:hypothetical protein
MTGIVGPLSTTQWIKDQDDQDQPPDNTPPGSYCGASPPARVGQTTHQFLLAVEIVVEPRY